MNIEARIEKQFGVEMTGPEKKLLRKVTSKKLLERLGPDVIEIADSDREDMEVEKAALELREMYGSPLLDNAGGPDGEGEELESYESSESQNHDGEAITNGVTNGKNANNKQGKLGKSTAASRRAKYSRLRKSRSVLVKPEYYAPNGVN